MGEVYRARDPRLGREVAIKVLPASFSQDADRLRRFEQEAKAAGVLNHPNITAVYDIGTHDDAPYVVQELLEGETLRSALAGGRLAAAQDDRLRAADRARPRRRAREGHRPPRPEAREPLRHAGRPRQDPRLRSRQADAPGGRLAGHEPSDGDGGHGARRRPRHARLHVARAGARQARRRALGHLLLRRDPLRDALGQEGVPRRLRRGHDVRDPQGRPARSLRHEPEHLARTRADRAPLPREEPRAALPLRPRPRLRPRGALGRHPARRRPWEPRRRPARLSFGPPLVADRRARPRDRARPFPVEAREAVGTDVPPPDVSPRQRRERRGSRPTAAASSTAPPGKASRSRSTRRARRVRNRRRSASRTPTSLPSPPPASSPSRCASSSSADPPASARSRRFRSAAERRGRSPN